MTLKLVVFDVDGTLVDSQHIIVHCMVTAFLEAGRPAPGRGAILALVGLPPEEMVARLGPDLDHDGVLAVAQGYRNAYYVARQMPEHMEGLFPGVRDMLAAVAEAGLLLGIATGKARRGLNAVLERHALSSFFATFQTGDLPPGKPHPAMLLRAVEEAGVEPAETMMIGDTTYDIEMARAAGSIPVGVAWGYHHADELIAAGAVHILREWAEMPPLIREWDGAGRWQTSIGAGGRGPTG